MHVESSNKSQNILTLGTQEKRLTDQAINLKEKSAGKLVREPDLSLAKQLVADIQNNFNNVELNYSVHKASGQIMITVIDESTGKIIREIPESEILELAAKMKEMVGMIFDQKA